jgi:hypothetical protein
MKTKNDLGDSKKAILSAECGDVKFRVESIKNLVQIAVRCPKDARHLYLLKSAPLPGVGRLGSVLNRSLTRSNLTVQVLMDGKSVARIGAAAKPSLLGRLVGFPGLEISLLNSIRFLTGLRL